MDTTDLKALLSDLRHAADFWNAVKESGPEQDTIADGSFSDAREWLITAALALGKTLSVHPDLGVGALQAELERERLYREILHSANAGLADKVNRLGGELDAAQYEVKKLRAEVSMLRSYETDWERLLCAAEQKQDASETEAGGDHE
ncbi:hypothetical protein ACEPVM_11770 [Pseudomonas aeruginosa]|uniref:hypothetical protein n=1 Tax=Pseudomonas aeruginosa TaxID=287 RepID=UPI00053D1D84|nr:hypothetical protein [Pseudomonas aeruginosa]KSO70928.1 hypothetical protein APB01_27335 [Pseudomonas aeruginosa]MBX6572405.1 hypothetical protein [Pseudomonas aeruginosa]MBX6827250.1 hypothetical protein [Pseudomonas aeruginosa]MCD2910866.1 hypothetical protein [Pseudomonas aeruginosa]MCZ7696114.1 hypothetical protein [Pseudomonas aeruginosa]